MIISIIATINIAQPEYIIRNMPKYVTCTTKFDTMIQTYMIIVGVNRCFCYGTSTDCMMSVVTFATIYAADWSVSIASL